MVMKKIIIATAFLIFSSNLFAGELVLEGLYLGKNLLVINPFADETNKSFCIVEVDVNGTPIADDINNSSFEIDFTTQGLKAGDKVSVKIQHKDGCTPKVINPEVLKPTASFSMVSIKVDDKNLKWVTRGEIGSLPFTVEEFRWNNWRKIAEVPGLGTPEKADYIVPVNSHVGANKYRISQTDYTHKPKFSKVAQYQTPMNVPEVTFQIEKGTKIKFSVETMYQIYDNFAKFIKEGVEKEVDISDLEKGLYHLYYDDKSADFTKK